MKVLLSGANGLIGSALVPFLSEQGYDVSRLVRKQFTSMEREIAWDPAAGKLDLPKLEGFDALVHLAGENIADGKWTPEKKARIRESRINSTRLLCQAIAKLAHPPGVAICASAIGYYGSRAGELLNEESAPGEGFLADLCRDWEAASEPLRAFGVRVVNSRIGVVLSAKGGALAMMLPPFRMGAGGRIGSGRQYMSWIAIDDVAGAINHLLGDESLSGPVNLVAPNAVTNLEFTRTLGHALGRPTIFPVPAFAARLLFGGMADELLLASARVQPEKLLSAGYSFRFPEIDAALRHAMGKSRT